MVAVKESRVIGRPTRSNAPALVVEGFREIWSRRRLARYLVHADLVKTGADTILGNVWWILDPLLQMVVYVVLVTVIFNVKQADYPLFVFAAILPWKWFTSSTNDAMSSVTSREKIIKQVKFPKIVLPLAATLGGIVSFAFGLIPLMGLLLLFYSDRISAYLLLIPLIAVVQFAFTLALAVFFAGANVFFRDLGNVARHLLRLWFYLSPALYTADRYDAIRGKSRILGSILDLNPWTVLFDSYHNVIYNTTWPDFMGLLVLFVASLVLLIFTTLFFKRVEPAFAKVL
ncbi:MAG TPA: ABC transporter permease [Candidatus Acidoferrum sp.]|jgi:ABC-type polysaccharide/polyol phosphate export permease|nr:ABC transporter permease [Candidatus Acidoferrum sp.]